MTMVMDMFVHHQLMFSIVSTVITIIIAKPLVEGQRIPNLDPSHVPYFLRNNLDVWEECSLPSSSCHNISRESVFYSCWGYESQCKPDHRFKPTTCLGDSRSWTSTKQEQEETFFNQADFGYVKQLRKEIFPICRSSDETASNLECSTNMKFCRARNIFMNFDSLINITEPMKYRGDVLSDGDVGGFGCSFNKQKLKSQGGHKSPLQSWFEELEHFTVLPIKSYESQCDITINEPTFITKLDATVNMYHHFCDFVNLYLTMHLNNSLNTLDRSKILLWDTYPYRSNFAISWSAFLKEPSTDLIDLSAFKGKTVCFKDIVFSLLPRMVFGMYYNMPLIPGCSGSGVFQAFREHMMRRLDIKDNFSYLDSKKADKPNRSIRITIIVRNTRFRRILNLDELVRTIQQKSKLFSVKTVDFNHQMPFKHQMEMIANTDILVGMHGAGLTHSLFLPDYAVLFELYNCDDEYCYLDLARLRGVKYMTWEKKNLVFPEDEGKHPTQGGPHAKFTNYSFDPQEFLDLITRGVKHVKSARQKYMRKKLGLDFIGNHDEL